MIYQRAVGNCWWCRMKARVGYMAHRVRMNYYRASVVLPWVHTGDVRVEVDGKPVEGADYADTLRGRVHWQRLHGGALFSGIERGEVVVTGQAKP